MPTNLGVILARGGSKRVPGKNIKPLDGKPLIFYTLDAALGSNLDCIVVSTDSSKIAEVVLTDYPEIEVVMRPDELATDDSPSIDALQRI